MNRGLACGLTLAAGLAVAACSERPQEQSLQGPSTVANVISPPCSPTNVFNNLISGYFENPQKQTVSAHRDTMLAAVDAGNLTLAQRKGFDILAEIADAAKQSPQPPAATGSQLAVETLECMFEDLDDPDVIEAVPGADFFTDALTRPGGGFEVRGGVGDPTGPVLAFGGNPVVAIAGIAPPEPASETWWDESLGDQRVLFYGEPGEASGYHWSVVPRDAVFDPALVVTTCVDDKPDPDEPGDPTLMLSETGVGVLAFTIADYIGCGTAFVPVSASSGRFSLLGRLASLGRELFLPTPASAAAVMPAVVGGSARQVKSLFDIKSVSTVALSVFQQPPSKGKVGVQFVVKFQAKTPPPSPQTVNGTSITVRGVNNNGTPTALFLDPDGAGPLQRFKCGEPNLPTCTVTTKSVGDVHGLAEFFLSVTKSGAIKFLATGDVDGRENQQVLSTSTNKMNVGP
jgi:hypothetical protein